MLYDSREQLNHLTFNAKKSATQSNISRLAWCVTWCLTNTNQIARVDNGARLLLARDN